MSAISTGVSLGNSENIEFNHGKISKKKFDQMGIYDDLCKASEQLGWKFATEIQAEFIPLSFIGEDILALGEIGCGKTGAYAMPILQELLFKKDFQSLFALVLTPTRRLAFKIAEQFKALCMNNGNIRVAVIVGGKEMETQAAALTQRPHIIVATPGRLADHLENTEGFSVTTLEFLVFHISDRILTAKFDAALNKILNALPSERRSFLLATRTNESMCPIHRFALKKNRFMTMYHR